MNAPHIKPSYIGATHQHDCSKSSHYQANPINTYFSPAEKSDECVAAIG